MQRLDARHEARFQIASLLSYLPTLIGRTLTITLPILTL